MAHGDYNCCAVCDKKMTYSSVASTKRSICSHCVAELATHGIIVHDVDELIDWVKNHDAALVERHLKRVGFSFCYWDNEVDEVVADKLNLEHRLEKGNGCFSGEKLEELVPAKESECPF